VLSLRILVITVDLSMESMKRRKLVVNNCVDKSKPLWANSWYNYLKGEAFVRV